MHENTVKCIFLQSLISQILPTKAVFLSMLQPMKLVISKPDSRSADGTNRTLRNCATSFQESIYSDDCPAQQFKIKYKTILHCPWQNALDRKKQEHKKQERACSSVHVVLVFKIDIAAQGVNKAFNIAQTIAGTLGTFTFTSTIIN